MKKHLSILMILLLIVTFALLAMAEGNPMPGAIWTTNSDGTAVNLNIYSEKTDVYLNGGPQNKNRGNALEPGFYYVRITELDGTEFGISDTPVVEVNSNGDFIQLYRLWDLVKYQGNEAYQDTLNSGGVYKVWISKDANFRNNLSKTDNYKNFRDTLLKATAKDMRYMLSAQLAAMKLNVLNGLVNGNNFVYTE